MPVIGKDVLVVLEVLPHLLVLITFQPGFEFRKRRVQIQLIRRTRINMRQRQICGLVRP